MVCILLLPRDTVPAHGISQHMASPLLWHSHGDPVQGVFLLDLEVMCSKVQVQTMCPLDCSFPTPPLGTTVFKAGLLFLEETVVRGGLTDGLVRP